MTGDPHRLYPWADPATRSEAVARLRDLVQKGAYRVPAEEVAAAVLVEWAETSEYSSWQGWDADAH